MPSRKIANIPSSEITDETAYFNRRKFMQMAGLATLSGLAGSACSAEGESAGTNDAIAFPGLKKSAFSTDEPPNAHADVTTYNNYYEFGTGKDDPSRYAQAFRSRPWQVTVAGECDKPGSYDYDDLMAKLTPEERIYRLRCVEAWSMVIPWVGVSMADLLRRFAPNSRAKYVKFTTVFDPDQMPGQRRAVLDWPYVEGLRIDEAMNPLTIMAIGLYGKVLPNQNGAPMRLIVPWKYGFKSIKAINRIEFTERQPNTSWELAAPREYGFYANVNPQVAHPRWSQARERRIGAGVFAAKQETLMFNGYGEQVAQLYSNLDLRRNY